MQELWHHLDEDTSNKQQNIFFDINLTNGVIGNFFQPQGGITVDAYGVVPYGDGWYRAFITITFWIWILSLRGSQIFIDGAGAIKVGQVMDLLDLSGVLNSIRVLLILTPQSIWRIILCKMSTTSKFTLDRLEELHEQALTGTLTSPSTNAGFFAFYDSILQQLII